MGGIQTSPPRASISRTAFSLENWLAGCRFTPPRPPRACRR